MAYSMPWSFGLLWGARRRCRLALINGKHQIGRGSFSVGTGSVSPVA